MTTPTDDRRDLVTVFASMRAAPGKEDELRRWLESVIEPTTRRPGASTTTCTKGSAPGRVLLLRELGDGEQLDAHRETPHMTEFAAVLDDLLDESGLTVHRARRIG